MTEAQMLTNSIGQRKDKRLEFCIREVESLFVNGRLKNLN